MLKINHIAKTFNPGTITEKVALVDVELHLTPRRLCDGHRRQWRGQVHGIERRGGHVPGGCRYH